MVISVLHKFIIALFSGFTEFFCVPAFPHLMLYEVITGTDQSDPMLSLAIHLGAFLAVIIACKKRLVYLFRADRQERNTRRRKNRHLDMSAVLETKMLKMALIPLLISVFFYRRAAAWVSGVAALSLTLLLNGVVLFLPRILPRGNKDSRMMSPLDSVVMGLGGALAVIPGVSRVGGLLTGGMVRGTDQVHGLEYSLLLSVPVLAVVVCFDVYAVIAANLTVTFIWLMVWLVAGAIAFGSAYLSILFMRFISMRSGFDSFCYYSWGMSLFSFVLYLLI